MDPVLRELRRLALEQPGALPIVIQVLRRRVCEPLGQTAHHGCEQLKPIDREFAVLLPGRDVGGGGHHIPPPPQSFSTDKLRTVALYPSKTGGV